MEHQNRIPTDLVEPSAPPSPKPISARRAAAARANGAKSRGPITPQGKARSSRNAVTHGLCAEDVVLPIEDAASFHALRSALFDTLKPLNPVAEKLAEAIVVARWRQSRIWEIETALLTDATECHDMELTPGIRLSRAFRALSEEPCLLLLDRYETRYERQFARAIRLYRQINHPDPDFFQTNPSANSSTPGAAADPLPGQPPRTFTPGAPGDLVTGAPLPGALATPHPGAAADPLPGQPPLTFAPGAAGDLVTGAPLPGALAAPHPDTAADPLPGQPPLTFTPGAAGDLVTAAFPPGAPVPSTPAPPSPPNSIAPPA